MSDYKVGDKVILTKTRPVSWNGQGLMDRFLGAEVTIATMTTGDDPRFFTIQEDRRWVFRTSDIVYKINPLTKKEGETHTIRRNHSGHGYPNGTLVKIRKVLTRNY